MQVIKSLVVVAAGFAFVLAAAALWAALAGFGMDPADWDPVAGTRVVLVCAAVVVAASGTAALTAILVFLLLAMAGRV